MSTVALGIAPDDDGNGVTPTMHRLCQMAQWETTGIVWGLDVTANTDLSYTVAPGVAITSRNDDDGYAVAYSEGGTVDTTDGDSDNPRYDVIWLKSNDLLQGDATNLVELGCTQGDAASSPTVPDVDEGAIILDYAYVPAGSAAGSDNSLNNEPKYASPTKSSCGRLLSFAASESDISISTSWTTRCSGTFHVPTRRSIRVTIEAAPYLEAADETCLPLSSFVYSSIQMKQTDENSWTTYNSADDGFRVAYPAVGGYYSRTTIIDRIYTVDEGYWNIRWRTKAMSDDYATVKLSSDDGSYSPYHFRVHDLGIAEDEE